jgi:hypothetical protein
MWPTLMREKKDCPEDAQKQIKSKLHKNQEKKKNRFLLIAV